MQLSKENLLHISIILLLIFPVVFSVFFDLTGIMGIPSNLIVICMCISLVLVIPIENIRRVSNPSILKLYIYVFFIYVLSTFFHSPSKIAKVEKLYFLLYSNLIPMLLLEYYFLIMAKDLSMLKLHSKISKVSFLILIIVFVLFLMDVRDTNFEYVRWTLRGTNNPIWFARFIGFLGISILLDPKAKILKKVITTVLLLILFYHNNSRGPFLSIIIVLLIYYFKDIKKGYKFFMGTLFLIVIYLGFSNLDLYLENNDDYSTYERKLFIDQLLEYGIFSLNGNGLASYGILLHRIDQRSYPHNIFLEILFENGLIGIVLFVLIVFLFLKKIEINLFSILVFYFLINSQVSGDLVSNNLLFISMIVYINFKKKGLKYN